MKKPKFTLYPLIIGVLLLGITALGLRFFDVTVWIESETPDISSIPEISPPEAPKIEKVKQPSPTELKASPKIPILETKPDVEVGQGGLRVSNPTAYPIRVALLARPSSDQAYSEPAHWDFSPLEGGTQGLLLSLPQGNLKLKKGDILVAFAQDGSRRYWGPFVVGETSIPVWNQEKAEWLLNLQP
jgi:hypothetical protein